MRHRQRAFGGRRQRATEGFDERPAAHGGRGALLGEAAHPGPGPATAVFAALMVINFVFGNVVEPRVMGRALGLSPLVVLISMGFWGWLA